MSIQNGINFGPQKSTWECFECSQMYDSNRYQLSIQKYTHIQSSVFFTFVPPLGSIVSIICPLDSKMSVKVDYSIIFWYLFVKNYLGLAFQFCLFHHKYSFGFTSKIRHSPKWIWLHWKYNPMTFKLYWRTDSIEVIVQL